jgi:hypothetical protein
MIEAAATVVAAGIILGGFVMGVAGFLAGWPRQELDERVLTDGYLGGLVGVSVAVIDLVFRYIV